MKTLDINRSLVRFSKILLRIHWSDYAQWLSYAVAYSLANFPDPAMMMGLLLLWFLSFLIQIITVRMRVQNIAINDRNDSGIMFTVGVGYFLSAILLIVLVELPIARYTQPAFLFFPSVLLMCIYENIRTTLRHANRPFAVSV
jgi:hypothetical protein